MRDRPLASSREAQPGGRFPGGRLEPKMQLIPPPPAPSPQPPGRPQPSRLGDEAAVRLPEPRALTRSLPALA